MTIETKYITPEEISGLIFREVFAGTSSTNPHDVDHVLSRASGHPQMPAVHYITKSGVKKMADLKLAYYPLAALRSPGRRGFIIADNDRVVADGHAPLFPEDCELRANLPLVDTDAGPAHAVVWSEMAWYLREAAMIKGEPLVEWLIPLDNSATWWHYPRDVPGEPGMVSYVPSHEYGKANRRVRIKVGKYLTRFYGKQLTAEQIRDVSNLATTGGILMSQDPKDFVRAYANGPQSCMSGAKFPNDDKHPALCYTFPGEFVMATIETQPGTITARAIVHVPSKSFVRLYGNDANKLQSKLEQQGYKKVNDYPTGTKFKFISMGDECTHVRLPYIDGGTRGVKHVAATDSVERHWALADDGVDITASDAGCTFSYDHAVHVCAECGAEMGNGSTVRVWKNGKVVRQCTTHDYSGYVDAKHSQVAGTFKARKEECVMVNMRHWYTNSPGELVDMGCPATDAVFEGRPVYANEIVRRSDGMVLPTDCSRFAAEHQWVPRDYNVSVSRSENNASLADITIHSVLYLSGDRFDIAALCVNNIEHIRANGESLGRISNGKLLASGWVSVRDWVDNVRPEEVSTWMANGEIARRTYWNGSGGKLNPEAVIEHLASLRVTTATETEAA